MSKTLPRILRDARLVIWTSNIFIFVFGVSIPYLLLAIPEEAKLETYQGYPSRLVERRSRFSKHLEFNLNANVFYYSGAKYDSVIKCINKNQKVTVSSIRNHGINNEMNVVYILDCDRSKIVSFKSAIDNNMKTLYLLLVGILLSCIGRIYGVQQLKKYQQ